MNLFAYGSLAIPEVLQALTGKSFPAQSCSLTGFARRSLKDRIYPGIIPTTNSVVQGKLFFGIDPDTQRLIDAFEDEIYDKTIVEIETSPGNIERALAYVVNAKHHNLATPEPWHLGDFANRYLDSYIEQCVQFRRSFSKIINSGVI
jgi:gamma-glutamylcyclotransferase (GGCT)/AIG2-like uncharacterized protein YtfP